MQALGGRAWASGPVSCHQSKRKGVTAFAWAGEASQKLAWSRSRESLHPSPLFIDSFSAALVNAAPVPEEAVGVVANLAPSSSDSGRPEHHTNEALEKQCALDTVCTKYLDEALLNALGGTNVNSISGGDYRQVILLGDGFDTRPFRLPWPASTIIFLVASKDVQEVANTVLKEKGAKVPPGCLLRRVPLDLQDVSRLPQDLAAAGFQSRKLSVWLLQGLNADSPLTDLLVEITNLSAFNSLILGELPVKTRREAGNKIAEVGLLGSILDPCGDLGRIYGRWPVVLESPSEAQAAVEEPVEYGDDSETTEASRWIFTSQMKQLSLAEMDNYEAHVSMAESVDEDYFDNIS